MALADLAGLGWVEPNEAQLFGGGRHAVFGGGAHCGEICWHWLAGALDALDALGLLKSRLVTRHLDWTPLEHLRAMRKQEINLSVINASKVWPRTLVELCLWTIGGICWHVPQEYPYLMDKTVARGDLLAAMTDLMGCQTLTPHGT